MLIPLSRPNINRDDKRAISNALNSQWLTGGPLADKFEQSLASYIGTKYAISVNSCTAALHLVLRALDIGKGDEVIVPTLTFAATANAAIFCEAKPVFADIDEMTFNISPDDIVRRITNRTKAIIVVHYAGQPCDMREINKIAEEHGLYVIEDCAHSLGASYDSVQTGALGVAGCFSFYPTKNITTLEGGMITTNDESIAKKVSLYRNHGMTKDAWNRSNMASWYYDVVDLGYNYRLNEVQSALGSSQLNRLDKMNNYRIGMFGRYSKALSKCDGIIIPTVADCRTHVAHLYVIRVIEKEFGISRNEVGSYLSSNGIGYGVHYTPLHQMSYYRNQLQLDCDSYPVANKVASEILSLPMFYKLKNSEVDIVIDAVRSLVSGRFR